MKYIAAAVILIAMAWTWKLTGAEPGLSLQEHKSLEMQVQDAIREAIKLKRPAATDVIFQQIFTETIRPNERVRARFRYSVTEPVSEGDVTKQLIEGVADLASEDGGRTWKWSGEDVKSPTLEFQRGSLVGPDTRGATAPPAEPEK